MKQYKIENLNSVYPEEGLTEKQSTQQEQALSAINRLYNEGNLNLCCCLWGIVNGAIRKLQMEKDALTKEKRRQSLVVKEEVDKMIQDSQVFHSEQRLD